jgi:hypothetical protein
MRDTQVLLSQLQGNAVYQAPLLQSCPLLALLGIPLLPPISLSLSLCPPPPSLSLSVSMARPLSLCLSLSLCLFSQNNTHTYSHRDTYTHRNPHTCMYIRTPAQQRTHTEADTCACPKSCGQHQPHRAGHLPPVFPLFFPLFACPCVCLCVFYVLVPVLMVILLPTALQVALFGRSQCGGTPFVHVHVRVQLTVCWTGNMHIDCADVDIFLVTQDGGWLTRGKRHNFATPLVYTAKKSTSNLCKGFF